jgi:hypothetical protein
LIRDSTVGKPFKPITEKIYETHIISVSFIENTFLMDTIIVWNTQGDISKLNCSKLRLRDVGNSIINIHPNVKKLSIADCIKVRNIKSPRFDLKIELDIGTRIKSLKLLYYGDYNYIKDRSYQFAVFRVKTGNKFLSNK